MGKWNRLVRYPKLKGVMNMAKNPFKQMDVIRKVSNEVMRDKSQLTNWRAEYIERCTFGSEEGNVKPILVTGKGVCSLSYNPKPSDADLQVHADLKNAFKTIGVNLQDSMVIGRDRYVSFKESGL
jgi:hypothetical protein